MRRIIAFIGAALTLAACTNPTAPTGADRSTDVAKAKAALGAVAKGASAERSHGKLIGN